MASDRFEVDGVRALSYEAVDATRELQAQTRAANEGKGYACTLCADTGMQPAPAPYGMIGCTWPCTCPAGDRARASESALTDEALQNALRMSDRSLYGFNVIGPNGERVDPRDVRPAD